MLSSNIQLTCAIFVSLNTFRAFLNGVGVRGDTHNKVLLMRGVRKGSSPELASSTPGVCSVVFVKLTWTFSQAGVDVWTLLEFTGELRNCEGENCKSLMGVAPLGLLKDTSVLTLWLKSWSADWRYRVKDYASHKKLIKNKECSRKKIKFFKLESINLWRILFFYALV